VANNITRVRLSELKLKVLVSGNGSRIIVTESSATALSLPASINSAGGGGCPVN
jgi:hypothetical protein